MYYLTICLLHDHKVFTVLRDNDYMQKKMLPTCLWESLSESFLKLLTPPALSQGLKNLLVFPANSPLVLKH